MKNVNACLAAGLLVLAAGGAARAQGMIYRCPGNEYTDKINAQQARAMGCKPMGGGNITVIESPRGAGPATSGGAAPRPATAAAPSAGPRVEQNEQRARDADARAILEGELRKSEARLAELQKDYNNGEPEKLGPEHRNHQKYLDRVAEMKASIARTESDIAGIKRELSRLNPAPAASAAR